MRNDFRAINEVARVVADRGELGHGTLEVGHHEPLVVDLELPFASGALNNQAYISGNSCLYWSRLTISRASRKSEFRRISPACGSGEFTSAPSVLLTPNGTLTPLRSVSAGTGKYCVIFCLYNRLPKKNWLSNVKGVLSKGTASWPGTSVSERAIVCEASRWTTSAGEKLPPSAIRSRIVVASLCGSGTVLSSAGNVAFGRPARNSKRGAPGQFVLR